MPLSENAMKQYKDEFDIYKIMSSNQTEKKKDELELLSFEDYIQKVKDKFGVDSREYLTVSLYKISTFRDDLGSLSIIYKKPIVPSDELNYIIVPNNKSKNLTILLNIVIF